MQFIGSGYELVSAIRYPYCQSPDSLDVTKEPGYKTVAIHPHALRPSSSQISGSPSFLRQNSDSSLGWEDSGPQSPSMASPRLPSISESPSRLGTSRISSPPFSTVNVNATSPVSESCHARHVNWGDQSSKGALPTSMNASPAPGSTASTSGRGSGSAATHQNAEPIEISGAWFVVPLWSWVDAWFCVACCVSARWRGCDHAFFWCCFASLQVPWLFCADFSSKAAPKDARNKLKLRVTCSHVFSHLQHAGCPAG